MAVLASQLKKGKSDWHRFDFIQIDQFLAICIDAQAQQALRGGAGQPATAR